MMRLRYSKPRITSIMVSQMRAIEEGRPYSPWTSLSFQASTAARACNVDKATTRRTQGKSQRSPAIAECAERFVPSLQYRHHGSARGHVPGDSVSAWDGTDEGSGCGLVIVCTGRKGGACISTPVKAQYNVLTWRRRRCAWQSA